MEMMRAGRNLFFEFQVGIKKSSTFNENSQTGRIEHLAEPQFAFSLRPTPVYEPKLMNAFPNSSLYETHRMPDPRGLRLRDSLIRLAAIHAAQILLLDESIAVLKAELNALSILNETHHLDSDSDSDSNCPLIDRRVMCVVYRGQRCFLGNTLMLKFMERLARRPNHYVSYEVLLNDVWNGIRESSSVRSVVKEIRIKLKAAGMFQLSAAIDGHVPGHYGLMLDRIG